MDNITLGKWGEKMAAAYLLKNGYSILEKNWRYSKIEIDIIAKENDVLVFVEIKTRDVNSYGSPEVAVNRTKKARQAKAADHYLHIHQLDTELRFDIIAIQRIRNGSKIAHFKDAFYPHF